MDIDEYLERVVRPNEIQTLVAPERLEGFENLQRVELPEKSIQTRP